MRSHIKTVQASQFFVVLSALIAAAFLALGAYLSYETLATAAGATVRSRFELTAQRVVSTIQRAQSTGLNLSAQATLPAMLLREKSQESAINRLDVADEQGRILYSTDPDRQGQPAGTAVPSSIETHVLDDTGVSVGRVLVTYNTGLLTGLEQSLALGIRVALWPLLALAFAGTLLMGAWLIRLVQSVSSLPVDGKPGLAAGLLRAGFRAGMSVLAALVLLLGLLVLRWQISDLADQSLIPPMIEKARSVARASTSQIAHALQTGVPLAQMQGIDQHFESVLSSGAEIQSITLRDQDGRVLHSSSPMSADQPGRAVEEPVVVDGQRVAIVRVSVDEQVLSSRLRASTLDTGFLAVVVLLIANELMALLGTLALSQRLIDQDQQLIRRLRPVSVGDAASASVAATSVRPVLFTFMMAEELTRSFLPSHAHALVPVSWDQGLGWGSVPLVIFLATVALCQLPFASLSARMGRQKGLLVGAVLAALGYALCAWTTSFGSFSGARLISALGFALVFVSAQGAVVDGSNGANRSQSLAMFVRAILMASLCGPPLGGVLADRWGVPVVFAVSAGLCLLAVLLARHLVPDVPQSSPPPWELGFSGLPAAMRSPPLRSLILGCALPAKLMLAASCFYLVPIGLAQAGYSRSEIGRCLMIYPFLMVVAIPFFSAWASRTQTHQAFVVAGGVLAGAHGVLALLPLNLGSVVAMLLMIGVGQAMSITSQTHLVVDLSQRITGIRSSTVLGFFRLMERGGSALGPIGGAMLLGTVGLAPALAASGFLVLAGNLAHAWASRGHTSNAAQESSASANH